MIFNNPNQYFESEKERNLYYKIFAGYICNEFIKGYEDRMRKLIQVFNKPIILNTEFKHEKIEIDINDNHISFDNHLYLFDELATDRGEFADVLIQSKSTRTIIAIEAKLHSNWSFEKDIKSNQDRLQKIEKRLSPINIYPILLVTKKRWDGALAMENNGNSNYGQLKNAASNKCRVILWEDVLKIIDHPKVVEYLEFQLKRTSNKSKYKFESDWFHKPLDS